MSSTSTPGPVYERIKPKRRPWWEASSWANSSWSLLESDVVAKFKIASKGIGILGELTEFQKKIFEVIPMCPRYR